MKNVRQDAWTVEDDQVLADIILRHIREGSTQLAAFQEVGLQLGRTEAACGFRWNAVIRKQYQTQIEQAKSERRLRRSAQVQDSRKLPTIVHKADSEEGLEPDDQSWDEVLKFLRAQKSESQVLASRIRQLERDLHSKMMETEHLSRENRALCAELVRSESELSMVRDDYRALLLILERARQQIAFEEAAEREDLTTADLMERDQFESTE